MKSFIDFSENLEDRKKQLMQKQKMMQQMEREKASKNNQQFKQDLEDKQSSIEKEKEEAKKREQLKKEIKDEIKDEMKDNVEEELNQDDKPFVKKLVGKLRKGSKTHAKQADDLEKAMTEESNPRIPRKKGQPAGSKKHSDLYTDENPKGTIHGLGFKDVATAKASVSKIRNSSRSHAHKIQAAVAMEQRAREMGKTSEAAVYRKFINTMKKKTKKMNEAANPAQQAAIAINMKKKGKKPKNMEEEGLRAWFGKSSGTTKSGRKVRGWVQVGGKYDGKPCARQPGQTSTPKCVSSAKRRSMSKDERDSAARRKRAADPNQPQKSGAAAPTNVSTDPKKKKVSEAMNFTKFKSMATDAAKSAVAKKSHTSYVGKRDAGAIAAKKMRQKDQEKVNFLPVEEEKKMPKGVKKIAKELDKAVALHASQAKRLRAAGVSEETGYSRRMKDATHIMILGKEVELDEKCWKGYEKKGMKTMFGKRYPNCVKKEAVEYTGPNKEDRKQIKKMDDPSYAKKLADYEKNMDPKKRQALKDKATKGMKFTHEAFSDTGMAKGSGKPSGAMKDFLDKKAKKLEKERAAQPDRYKNNPAFDSTSPNSRSTDLARSRAEEVEMVDEKIKYDKSGSSMDYFLGADPKKTEYYKKNVKKKTKKEEVEVVTEVKDKKGKGSGTKDACYHKVKSRYSVWPSAYASGALVKCRKVGAANWGNSSKKEQFSDWKSEFIWEDGDSEKKLLEDDMKGMSVKSGHKRPTKSGAGMTAKGVAAYRRRNPGSKLKTAVTTKPSKLKKGSKAANRRKSYCARSAGQMKKFPKAAKDPNSRLRQARRRWNC